MTDNRFWMIGKVTVPQNKKNELNRYVLELLFKGGIRKTEEIELAGRKLTVIKRPCPDEKGIVCFDYCIFEDLKRKTGIYDTNTCELQVTDCGYHAYGVVILMIMTLQEAYSDGNCYVMYQSEPFTHISSYLKLIYSLTGKKIYLDSRGRFFDMVLFFRKNDSSVTFDVIFECCCDCMQFSHWNALQNCTYFEIKNTTSLNFTDEDTIHSKADIENATHISRKEHLYHIILKLVNDNDEDFFSYLSMLVTLNLKQREELAKNNEPYGSVAKTSLYMYPATIICIYAFVKGMDFWNIWDLLPSPKYKDIYCEDSECNEEVRYPVEYYNFILRKNQDEFLEFWDGENLIISDDLMNSIEDWKEKLNQASDINPESVSVFLSDIIFDLENDWHCRLVDKELVDLIMSNKDNPSYRKALRVLRDFMDEDVKLFPELTRRQAIDWMIHFYRDTDDKIKLSAYLSLLMNEQQRGKILGF